MSDKNILIAGIGAVGGILAGQLVKTYGDSVSLIARGARKEHLCTKGLTIESDLFGSYNVKPARVEENAADMPVQDFIFICTKNDALLQVIDQIKPAIGEDTIIVPVMNGVTAGDVIRNNIDAGTVVDSVIYIVAGAEADFSVRQMGNFTNIHVGSLDRPQKARMVCDVLKDAGFKCRNEEDVRISCWTKYILNCAYNVVTARWDINIGTIKRDEALRYQYRTLLEEAAAVARRAGIGVADDVVDRHMERLNNTEDESLSSLSRDFSAGRVGEMELFSGDLIRMAEKYGVDVPMTREYYRGMKDRVAGF